jgi:hypothetical protein
MKLKAKAYLRIAPEDWRKKCDWVGNFHEASLQSNLTGSKALSTRTGMNTGIWMRTKLVSK